MRKLWGIALLVSAFMCGCVSESQLSNVVTSPDGRIVVEVGATDEGVPYYILMFDG